MPLGRFGRFGRLGRQELGEEWGRLVTHIAFKVSPKKGFRSRGSLGYIPSTVYFACFSLSDPRPSQWPGCPLATRSLWTSLHCSPIAPPLKLGNLFPIASYEDWLAMFHHVSSSCSSCSISLPFLRGCMWWSVLVGAEERLVSPRLGAFNEEELQLRGEGWSSMDG